MTTIETTCRRCGRTFTPTAQDIRAGLWRACPPCRDQDARKSPPKSFAACDTLDAPYGGRVVCLWRMHAHGYMGFS
jgi:hypothetical protein